MPEAGLLLGACNFHDVLLLKVDPNYPVRVLCVFVLICFYIESMKPKFLNVFQVHDENFPSFLQL